MKCSVAVAALVALPALSARAAPDPEEGARGLATRVAEVTVYADRARVARRVTLDAAAETRRFAIRGLPGWLDEGLAEYVAAGAQGTRGRVHARPGGIATPHFQTHADNPDEYDFKRVLSFGSDDFVSTSKQALKYAQSYTLVYFLLHP